MEYSGKVDIDHVLNSKYLEQFVRDETEKVAARARALAPVQTGELKRTIKVRVEKHSGAMRDRVVGFVTTSATAADGSAYGAASEFGTSRQRGTFFLRRALGG